MWLYLRCPRKAIGLEVQETFLVRVKEAIE
jgi:hypothetical protein